MRSPSLPRIRATTGWPSSSRTITRRASDFGAGGKPVVSAAGLGGGGLVCPNPLGASTGGGGVCGIGSGATAGGAGRAGPATPTTEGLGGAGVIVATVDGGDGSSPAVPGAFLARRGAAGFSSGNGRKGLGGSAATIVGVSTIDDATTRSADAASSNVVIVSAASGMTSPPRRRAGEWPICERGAWPAGPSGCASIASPPPPAESPTLLPTILPDPSGRDKHESFRSQGSRRRLKSRSSPSAALSGHPPPSCEHAAGEPASVDDPAPVQATGDRFDCRHAPRAGM